MSAFSDIVDAITELHIAPSRTPAPSSRVVTSVECADALETVLSLAQSVGQYPQEMQSLDLVQNLEVLWPDEASREKLCSLGGEQAQRMVDVLQQLLDLTDAGHQSRRCMIYILVKLCLRNTTFPSSLFIPDVDIGHVRDPVEGGGFADIFKGRRDGLDVAVKRLRTFEKHRARIHKELCREALIWRQMHHPNVLPFIGLDRDTFASTNHICMVSPWMPHGSLDAFVGSKSYQALQDCHRLAVEVAAGLMYLHSHKVVHADIHGGNVLVDAQRHAKITDFGLVVIGENTVGNMTMSHYAAQAGHIRYAAPERISPQTQGQRRHPAVDVYAFAWVCLLLHTGRRPFEQYESSFQVMQDVLSGQRPGRPDNSQCFVELSDVVWNVIIHAWSQDPLMRPNMDHVHGQLCQVMPENRASSEDPLACQVPHAVTDETIFLPLNAKSRHQPGPSLMQAKGAVSDGDWPALPISVLLVEDNVVNQKLMAAFLHKMNIKFDVAGNGEEAIQKWQSGVFHLILMDIQMPIMDGLEATKEIRHMEKLYGSNGTPSSVIIVALTASSLLSDREAALSAGCNDFLSKPVPLSWLKNKIVEWGSMKTLQMWADLRPALPRMITERQEAMAENVARHLHLPSLSSRFPNPSRTPQSSAGTLGGPSVTAFNS